MADNALSIPNSLEEASVRFREFLRQLGWPTQVHWVARENVLINKKSEYWMKGWSGEMSEALARDTYMEGVKRKLGSSLTALSKTETATFAYVYVPTDHQEAARLLISGLKLSAPTSPRRARVAGNPLLWWALRRLYQKHTDQFIADILS